MKAGLLASVSLLLTVFFVGCRPERFPKSGKPHTMAFAQAGVSLTLGEEWQCQDASPDNRLFPPTLVSDVGTIRVLLLPADRPNPEQVADGLRADFDINPQVAKHSFRKQLFTNNNGVRGLCVSYLEQSNAAGRGLVLEHAHFLVQNKAGRCVVINFIASAEGLDTLALHRMLQTSLALL